MDDFEKIHQKTQKEKPLIYKTFESGDENFLIGEIQCQAYRRKRHELARC